MGTTVIRHPQTHFLDRSPKFITLDRNPLGNGPMEIISPLLHQTCIGLFVFLLLLAGWTDLTIPNQLPVALFVLVIPFGITSQGGPSSNSLDLNTLIDALDDEGLITVLAKTNLTALSSKPAAFLAGDEFLIVVPFAT